MLTGQQPFRGENLLSISGAIQQDPPPALTIVHLYKSRWQVELFFKWIKQHLRIKAFYGTSENAVKTQMWSALAVDGVVLMYS